MKFILLSSTTRAAALLLPECACGDDVAAGGERTQPFRLKGPAIESIKLDAEIDATNQLASPDQKQATATKDIQLQLVARETVIHPTSSQRQFNNALAVRATVKR